MRAKDIAEKLSRCAERVAKNLLPHGKLMGNYWVVGDVFGKPGESLKLCIHGTKKGSFYDFATSQGGDLLELWRLNRQISVSEAIKEASSYLGISLPTFVPSRQNIETSPSVEKLPKSISANAKNYLHIERKLSLDTIDKFSIRGERNEERDNDFIAFPFFTDSKKNKLTQIKWIGVRRGQNNKKIIFTERNCNPGLFGWHAIANDTRTIVLTEGEIDAMTLHQYGFNALSLPYGGGKGSKQAWLEKEFDRLAIFDEIFLCLDNDEVGKQTIDVLVERLGSHRCRVVTLPKKDANECLQAGITRKEINTCFANAKCFDPSEFRRFSDFREAIKERFYPQNNEIIGYNPPFDKCKGKILFRPKELSLWSGINGHGKSQFLGHLILDFVKQDAKVCIASLELSPEILLTRLARQASAQTRPTKAYIDAICDYYADKIWLFNVTGQAKADRLLEVFLYARQKHNVDVFIIDSLMMCGLKEDDYDAQKRFVERLCEFKNTYNCHVHLVAHPRKGADESRPPGKLDIKGTGSVSDLADNNFVIWRNKKKENDMQQAENEGEAVAEDLKNKCDCLLICDKNRNGDWEGKASLWYDKKSYQYLNYRTQKPNPYVSFFDKSVNETVYDDKF